MILVKNLATLGDINFLAAGRLGPRQRGHPLEIRARDHVLGGRRSHFGQALDFAVTFFLRFGGHAGFFDLLAQLVDFLHGVVGFAQLLLNRFHLLAQKVFALVLAHLLLNLFVNLRAQFQDFELFGKLANERL